jgi:hypothetical protein
MIVIEENSKLAEARRRLAEARRRAAEASWRRAETEQTLAEASCRVAEAEKTLAEATVSQMALPVKAESGAMTDISSAQRRALRTAFDFIEDAEAAQNAREAEQDALEAWQDAQEEEQDALEAEQDALEAEQDALEAEQDALEAGRDEERKLQIKVELDALLTELGITQDLASTFDVGLQPVHAALTVLDAAGEADLESIRGARAGLRQLRAELRRTIASGKTEE